MAQSLLDLQAYDVANEDRKKVYGANQRPHKGRHECPFCLGPMHEFKHVLSKGLAGTLIRIYRHTSPVRAQDLGLNYTAQSCLQKLRYWNLIKHVTEVDKRTGLWSITDTGEQFVRGTIRLQRFVWTYRANIVEYEGEEVLITDLVKDFRWTTQRRQDPMPSRFPRPELSGGRSTGIIRTLPYFGAGDTEDEGARRDAYKEFLRAFKGVEEGRHECVRIAFPQMPTQDVLHCYILIGGRIRVRGNIAGWEKGDGSFVKSWDGHDLKDSKFWCLVTGPISWPSEPVIRRGFQGFRYTGDLW